MVRIFVAKMMDHYSNPTLVDLSNARCSPDDFQVVFHERTISRVFPRAPAPGVGCGIGAATTDWIQSAIQKARPANLSFLEWVYAHLETGANGINQV